MAFTTPDDHGELGDVTFGAVAFANATATFVFFGAVSSLFGPLLISFSRRFHLSLPTAGTALSVFFVGAFVGVPLGYLGIKRYRSDRVLAAMMLLAAMGALVGAVARLWLLFLLGILFLGVAFGAVDFSLNTLLMRTESDGRGHRLSLANAGYGVGAVLGPVTIILVRPSNFPILLGAVAVGAAGLSPFFRGIAAPSLPAPHPRRSLFTKGRRRSILLTFIVAYVLYVCVETATSGWIAPQLHRTGFSQSLASVVTAGFWGSLALGRMVGGPLATRWSEKALVLGGLGGAVVLAASATCTDAAPFAYPLLGLIIASVYPMGLIWYTSLSPDDGDGLATLILCMMLGGVLGPATEGLAVSLEGIHAVPIVIGAFALLDLIIFASALRYDGRATPHSAP